MGRQFKIQMVDQSFTLCRKAKDRSKVGGFRWRPEYYWGKLEQLARGGLDRLVAENLGNEAKDFEQVKEAVIEAKQEMTELVAEYRDEQRQEPVQAETAKAD